MPAVSSIQEAPPGKRANLSASERGVVTQLSAPHRSPTQPVRRWYSLPKSLESPIFIVAAPRSGSTLLFETLARSESLCSVGGEAHWLVENHKDLRPGEPGVDSNRLTADQ